MKMMLFILPFYISLTPAFGIDTHNFLNANYLPYTLMLESSLLDNTTSTNDNVTANGDMINAISTMRYHRSMINEYLCHNFVAKEILEEFGLQGYTTTDRFGTEPDVTSRELPPIDRNELLTDIGSNNYKKWLAKSAVLSDIYRRYDMQEEADNSQIYANGDITGYAIQTDEKSPVTESQETEAKHKYIPFKPLNQYHDAVLNLASTPDIDVYNPHQFLGPSDHGLNHGAHVPDTGHGYSFGHYPATTNIGYEGLEHYHTPMHYPTFHHHVEEEKGLALKDLFNLALTALAFLAFGMFILNLIMACFSGPATTVVMQMTQDTVTDGDDNNKRTKRDATGITREKLNRLTYHVLNSIDALIMMQEDNTQEHCLKRSLCESNRFSRFLPINQQIWLPVWSFGVSWISGKINPESRLENLRAILFGLSKVNCRTIYNKCPRRNENRKRNNKRP